MVIYFLYWVLGLHQRLLYLLYYYLIWCCRYSAVSRRPHWMLTRQFLVGAHYSALCCHQHLRWRTSHWPIYNRTQSWSELCRKWMPTNQTNMTFSLDSTKLPSPGFSLFIGESHLRWARVFYKATTKLASNKHSSDSSIASNIDQRVITNLRTWVSTIKIGCS